MLFRQPLYGVPKIEKKWEAHHINEGDFLRSSQTEKYPVGRRQHIHIEME